MSKKILVVDDDEAITDSLSLILEAEGFSVATTTKGEETFMAINTFKPDLILLDVLLSGNDGRHICRQLKKTLPTRHIPVIMISAHPSALEDYSDCGAQNFLAKPFELNRLLSLIHQYTR
jgi:DNA-binding response OmpR family regulator